MRPPYFIFSLTALAFIYTLASSAACWAEEIGGPHFIRLPDFNCTSNDQDQCFEQAKKALAGIALDQDTTLQRNSVTHDVEDRAFQNLPNNRTPWGTTAEYSLRSGRSKVVFIFAHGLDMGPAMWDMQTMYASDMGMNSLSIMLPGHGDQWQYARDIYYQDWMEETRRAIKIAHWLGDKVVLVGHSTGAILGVAQALDDPKSVDGLILLEPAIKVLPYIAVGTCLGRHVVDSPTQLPHLMKLAGYDPCTPGEISLNMGCEVTKIRNHLISEFLPEKSNDKNNAKSNEEPVSSIEKSRELGALLRVPTLVINNPSDNAVSSRANRAFAKGLESTHEGELEEIPKGTPHAQLTFNYTYSNNIQKGMEDFLSHDLGMNNVLNSGRYHYFELHTMKYLANTIQNIGKIPKEQRATAEFKKGIVDSCEYIKDRIPNCLDYFQQITAADAPALTPAQKQQGKEITDQLQLLYGEKYGELQKDPSGFKN